MMYLSLFFLFLGVLLLIICHLIMPKNKNFPKKVGSKNHKYCILIPARNESKVIESLLISIQNQTRKINSRDVYIIVEDSKDLTISIAKNII